MMKANAARDPYWQAAARREMLEHPTAAAAIQGECSKCHMPKTGKNSVPGESRNHTFDFISPAVISDDDLTF